MFVDDVTAPEDDANYIVITAVCGLLVLLPALRWGLTQVSGVKVSVCFITLGPFPTLSEQQRVCKGVTLIQIIHK